MLKLQDSLDNLSIFSPEVFDFPITGNYLDLINQERQYVDNVGGSADFKNLVVMLLDQIVKLSFLLLRL